jgi:MFS transporter, putative metabolite:H+ symporter
VNATEQMPSRSGKLIFRHPRAFYTGCVAVAAGVLLHIPMLYQARDMRYKLSGMGMDPGMWVGMALILVGLGLAAYGITPPIGEKVSQEEAHRASHWSIKALDDVPLGREHWTLIVVLGVGLIIDIMKPASLAFNIPGMKAEYGLSPSVVILQPFSALTGLVLGSFIWGWFGDRIGRRATILFAALMFMGTAICGAMPAFWLNCVMCFLMGLAAGGFLPIAVALLSEILPVRSRAPLVVLLGGIGAAGGWLVASWAATALIPTFSWRVMWLLNLPTGMILLLLNRFIPESPRFLLSHGRVEEAKRILSRFGVGTVQREANAPAAPAATAATHAGTAALFHLPYLPQTFAISLYATAWGLVNYGFLLWLPTNLQSAGFGEQSGNAILAKAALVAFPGVLVVAWLYWRWSSKKTMLLASLLTTGCVLAFLPLSHGAQEHTFVLSLVIVALLVSSSAMAATMSPYAAEVYPTSVRTTGSGLAAGGGKFGGLAGQGAVVAHLTPTLAVAAPLVAIPVALAMLVMGAAGHETRGRRLEETSGEESDVVTMEAAIVD